MAIAERDEDAPLDPIRRRVLALRGTALLVEDPPDDEDAVHTPAAVMTPPSPPGRWNALPSARWNSSTSTPAATSRTAASTNENAPQAVWLSEAGWILPDSTTKNSRWYQGRNRLRNSPIEA